LRVLAADLLNSILYFKVKVPLEVYPMKYFHQEQINDFLEALLVGRDPMVTGNDGRVTVEIFTAIYRSARDNMPVKWPLQPEGRNDFDGRLRT